MVLQEGIAKYLHAAIRPLLLAGAVLGGRRGEKKDKPRVVKKDKFRLAVLAYNLRTGREDTADQAAPGRIVPGFGGYNRKF
jgi:hypothetical protein